MEKYKILAELGEGAYGSVLKALNKENQEIVAIKKMKNGFRTWDECLQLREIQSLQKLKHPNIVKLKEVVKVKQELNLIFEYMDSNLLDVYEKYKKSGQIMSESMIKSFMFQVFSALAHMHKHGFFHRDMKPENLLVQDQKIKIADFGLTREVRSKPPFTEYVSTRWYRAPELLLRATNYNSPVDIFAMGCIMAELYLNKPLFSGSSELDQIYKICAILGTPQQSQWPDGYKLASQMGYTFPMLPGMPLEKVISNASANGIKLLAELLIFDPNRRPNANSILQHEYFQGIGNEKGNYNRKICMMNSRELNKTNRMVMASGANNTNKSNSSKKSSFYNDQFRVTREKDKNEFRDSRLKSLLNTKKSYYDNNDNSKIESGKSTVKQPFRMNQNMKQKNVLNGKLEPINNNKGKGINFDEIEELFLDSLNQIQLNLGKESGDASV